MTKQNKKATEDPVIEECVDSVVQVLTEHHQSDLESTEQFQEKTRIQVREELKTYQSRLAHGYAVLLEELDRESQQPGDDASYLPGLLRP